MWFNANDIKYKKIINVPNIRGFILPHAGTSHTGEILSHTLRFKPQSFFTNILILYYPALDTENVKFENKMYYHEYIVPWRTLQYVIPHLWGMNLKNITFRGYNVREKKET
jgi:hypothetical protein